MPAPPRLAFVEGFWPPDCCEESSVAFSGNTVDMISLRLCPLFCSVGGLSKLTVSSVLKKGFNDFWHYNQSQIISKSNIQNDHGVTQQVSPMS